MNLFYRTQNSLFGIDKLKCERLLHVESNCERIVLLILPIQIVSWCIDKIDCQNLKKIKKTIFGIQISDDIESETFYCRSSFHYRQFSIKLA